VPKRKGLLQKLSIVFSVISFALALIAGIMLFLRVASVGGDNPISASLMASTFFFICVGTIFAVIGNADIPSFKFDDSEGNKNIVG
jgi:hypothetical protein